MQDGHFAEKPPSGTLKTNIIVPTDYHIVFIIFDYTHCDPIKDTFSKMPFRTFPLAKTAVLYVVFSVGNLLLWDSICIYCISLDRDWHSMRAQKLFAKYTISNYFIVQMKKNEKME